MTPNLRCMADYVAARHSYTIVARGGGCSFLEMAIFGRRSAVIMVGGVWVFSGNKPKAVSANVSRFYTSGGHWRMSKKQGWK